jgi:RNA polymerase sigma factor (sigma-70 family)
VRAATRLRGGPSDGPGAGVFEAELEHVYRTFRRLGARPAEAEDMAQDVFLVMCRRWGDFRPGRPLRPWLAGIAHYVALEHFRKWRQREASLAIVEPEAEAADPEQQLAAARARQLALRALEALPELQRSILVKHDLEGVPIREIAAEGSMPFQTAAARLRRARLRFAKVVRRMEKGRRALLLSPGAPIARLPRGEGAASAWRRLVDRLGALVRLPTAAMPVALTTAAVVGALGIGLVATGRFDAPSRAGAATQVQGQAGGLPRALQSLLPRRWTPPPRLAPAPAEPALADAADGRAEGAPTSRLGRLPPADTGAPGPIGTGWTESFPPYLVYQPPGPGRLTLAGNEFHFWLLDSDVSSFPGQDSGPRSEIHIRNEYRTGQAQFQADFKIDSGCANASVMQVFGATGRTSAFMAFVLQDSLSHYRDEAILSPVHDRWFRLNVLHDTATRRIEVYVDGQKRGSYPDHGAGLHHFRCGLYYQPRMSARCDAHIKNIRVFKK